MGAKAKPKKRTKKTKVTKLALPDGHFELGVPHANSKLKVVFRQPTHEEFNAEEYYILLRRFVSFQDQLRGAGAPTPAEDVALVKKSGETLVEIARRVMSAMQTSQVSNNKSDGTIKLEEILLADGMDAIVEQSYDDGGAIEGFVSLVLPDLETLGN